MIKKVDKLFDQSNDVSDEIGAEIVKLEEEFYDINTINSEKISLLEKKF